MHRISLFVILLLGAQSAVLADALDDHVKAAMQQQHIPGVSLAVIKDGALIKSEGYGLADMEHNIAARPETVYKIGSVSKQFIAAGIMLLVQDGKIAVDDKVGKYLKGTPETWQAITIRHLLTHTSGLIREGPGFDPYKVQPDIDVIKTGFPRPLQFRPGEKYEYSNLGYFVLAEVIREVSGKAWDQFLKERAFAPLGMTATRATSVYEIVPNRADGYEWKVNKFENMENWPTIRPSGAFLSTTVDLAKWEAALQTDSVLNASTKAQMWSPAKLNDGQASPYGFGWQLDGFPSRIMRETWAYGPPPTTRVPMIRHGGTIPGFRAYYCRWPNHGLTVIVLTNLEDAVLDGLVANIATTIVPELKVPTAR